MSGGRGAAVHCRHARFVSGNSDRFFIYFTRVGVLRFRTTVRLSFLQKRVPYPCYVLHMVVCVGHLEFDRAIICQILAVDPAVNSFENIVWRLCTIHDRQTNFWHFLTCSPQAGRSCLGGGEWRRGRKCSKEREETNNKFEVDTTYIRKALKCGRARGGEMKARKRGGKKRG